MSASAPRHSLPTFTASAGSAILVAVCLGATPGLAAAQSGALATTAESIPGPAAPRAPENHLDWDSDRRSFDVPAGALGPTLNILAARAGVQLVFNPESVAGRQSPGVRGEFTLRQALERVLSGSGLAATVSGTTIYVGPGSGQGAGATAGAAQGEGGRPMPDVRVRAARVRDELPVPFAGGQLARGASTGLLGPTDYMANPYSQTAVTATQIENTQARTLTEALASEPTVMNVYQTPGYYAERFLVRGFNVNETTQTDIQFNGLYGLASNYTNSSIFAERIEVLKGPSALLTGAAPSGSLGATVNIVPKRAADRPLNRITLDYMSDTQFGTHVDVGRRFGQDNEWGVRFNGRVAGGETTTDDNRLNRQAGAVAIDYRGTRVRAALDLIEQRNNTRRLPSYTAIWSYEDTALPTAPNMRLNTSDPSAWSRERNRMILLTGEVDVSDRWTVFGAAGHSRWSYRAAEMVTQALDSSGDTSRELYGFHTNNDRSSYRLGVRGRLETGAIKHRLVATLDRYRSRQFDCTNSLTLAAGNLNRGESGPGADFSIPSSATNCGGGLVVDDTMDGRQKYTIFDSAAIADVISLAEDRLQLTLGLRAQRIKQTDRDWTAVEQTHYDRSALTPTMAALWRLTPAWSLYGSRIEGLAAGDVAPTLDDVPDVRNPGQSLAPYKTRQHEIGLKYDGGSLGATVAVFRAERPSASVGPDNYFAVNGERRTTGLELAVFGEPLRGVRVLGGLAVLDARIQRTVDGVNEGNRPQGVPLSQVKLDAEWDVPGSGGLTATGGLVRMGRQAANDANTLWVGNSTVWNLGARYAVRLLDRPVTFRGQILNLTNRRYWGATASYGGLFLAAPRTLMLSASVDL